MRRTKRERQQFLFPELSQQPITKRRAAQILDSMFEIVKKALERGDFVRISGFGKFRVKFKWARKGRNPKTGEQIILDSKRVVTFHPSPKLRGEDTD